MCSGVLYLKSFLHLMLEIKQTIVHKITGCLTCYFVSATFAYISLIRGRVKRQCY